MLRQVRAVWMVLAIGGFVFSGTACERSPAEESSEGESTASSEQEKAEKGEESGAEDDSTDQGSGGMETYELGEGHIHWHGWVAKAPKGLNLSRADVKGVRLAREKGTHELDVKILTGHKDLARIKKSVKLPASTNAELQLDFFVDEDDDLRWKSAHADRAPTWSFAKHMTVGERKITCTNNHMKELGEKEMIERAIAICESVRRKKRK